MIYYLNILLFIPIILTISAYRNCHTPDNELGNCIPWQDCTSIIDALRHIYHHKSSLEPNWVPRLKRYQCGLMDGHPKVCCPSKPIVLEKISKNEPPDVSKHPNIQFLPKNCGEMIPYGLINQHWTSVFEFPFVARLYFKRNSNGLEEYGCGGTIINANYILTAAHCITDPDLTLLKVRVGEHNASSPIDCDVDYLSKVCVPPAQDLEIWEQIPHPKYNKNGFINDIALIRVSPINITIDNVKPVCLPLDFTRTLSLIWKNALTIGFGREDLKDPSEVLIQVGVPIGNLTSCRRYYPNIDFNAKYWCGSAKNRKDSCEGDYGGPLLMPAFLYEGTRFVLHGVFSFGPRMCALNERPAVYTRVAYYMDWILDNLKN